MNAIPQLHPIVELRRFVTGCLRVIRRTPNVDAELMFDGAKDIAEDIAKERIDRECRLKAQIAKAQRPDSPGGRNITPTEIEPIVAEANGMVELIAGDVEAAAKVA
jgi:hypothetical protein